MAYRNPGPAIVALSKDWTYSRPSGGGAKTEYQGGGYTWHTAAFTPAGGTAVGTAGSAYAAHACVVLGAASTDMVVRATGMRYQEDGTLTPGYTEDMNTSGGILDDYFETSAKFVGQVTFSLFSGTGVIVNGGFAKYWDAANMAYTITGLECTGTPNATDVGLVVRLIKHVSTAFTYAAGGAALVAAQESSSVDLGANDDAVAGELWAWKRTGMSVAIAGAASEGIMWEITTTVANSIRGMSINLQYTIP